MTTFRDSFLYNFAIKSNQSEKSEKKNHKLLPTVNLLAKYFFVVQPALGKDRVATRKCAIHLHFTWITLFETFFAAFVILLAVYFVPPANLGASVVGVSRIGLHMTLLGTLVTTIQTDVARRRADGFFRLVSAFYFDFVIAMREDYGLWKLAFVCSGISMALHFRWMTTPE